MKFSRITLVVGVSALSLVVGHAVTSPEEVPTIYNQVTEIKHAKDAAKAVQLLEKLESFDYWGMGGGRGPTDRASLSMTVLVATREFLAWDVRPAEVPASRSPTLQTWLRAEPQSAESMFAMLEEADALPRFMALAKLRTIVAKDAAVLDKVEQIAATDGRLGIQLQSTGNREGSEHVFIAPLRDLAREVLDIAGRTVPPVDYDELSREGLRWLGGNYFKHEGATARISLQWALQKLTPKTPDIANAQAALKQATTSVAMVAFFERLARGENIAPDSRTAVELQAASTALEQQIATGPTKRPEWIVENGLQLPTKTRWLSPLKLGLLILTVAAIGISILHWRR